MWNNMGGELFHDDAAVSPVVGVVLMVGITVILATTTAAFVLGTGGTTDNTAPQADFTYEYSPSGTGQLTMLYEEGDDLDPSNIEVRVASGQIRRVSSATGSPSGGSASSFRLDSNLGGSDWVSDDITAGAEFSIVGASSDPLARTTVTVVWVDPSGGRTDILGEWSGPEA